MKKILVLGATGMLGHKLCQRLPLHGFEVVGTVRQNSDLKSLYPGVYDRCQLVTDIDVFDDGALARVFTSVQPDVVVNCVGIVKQAPEASDPLLSVAINAYLPHKLAKLCADQGRRLIHISTDCVFAGTRGAYREDDESDAKDLYGKSKFLGETTPTQPAALTLRTSIIGRELSEPGHGLASWFLSQQGKKVKGFANAVFSGLTTLELAAVIAKIIQQGGNFHGLRHVASTPIDKWTLLKLIRREYGLDIEIERDETVRVNRSLVMNRFQKETGYEPPDWESMVREMRTDDTPYGAWRAMQACG